MYGFFKKLAKQIYQSENVLCICVYVSGAYVYDLKAFKLLLP